MFLHTYLPSRILISFGPVNVYWYGFFIVIGILLAINIAMKLASYYKASKDTIIDLAFWLIIAGVAGARIYEGFLEWDYFSTHFWDIFKLWQGGLAIHGAIIGGALALFIYVKKYKIDFWLFAAIIVPGLALAQAVGRWGNYFNQELFGLPTDLPWGIPIAPANRLMEYYNFQFFHPTFLYESLGSLLIFFILAFLHYRLIKNNKGSVKNIVLVYLVLYSVLRLVLENWRIDPTPLVYGLRLPQLVSLIVIIISLSLYFRKPRRNV